MKSTGQLIKHKGRDKLLVTQEMLTLWHEEDQRMQARERVVMEKRAFLRQLIRNGTYLHEVLATELKESREKIVFLLQQRTRDRDTAE